MTSLVFHVGPGGVPVRQKPFVVRSGDGRMWLGGRRHDEGPWWRLQLRDAQRFRTLAEAEQAARWSGGTVEKR